MNLPNDWLFLGAFGGLLAACWSRIQLQLTRLVSMVFVTARLETRLANDVGGLLQKRRMAGRFGTLFFGSGIFYVNPLRRRAMVAYERLGAEERVFWLGRVPVVFGFSKNQDSINGGVLRFVRGTLNLDKLLADAAAEHTNHIMSGDRRFYIKRLMGTMGRNQDERRMRGSTASPVSAAPEEEYNGGRIIGWKTEDIGRVSVNGKLMGALAMSHDSAVVESEFKHWLDSGEWYAQRQIPWRRGLLLHGPTGTGKSSFVRALASDYDVPICVFDLATMSNQDFSEAWNEMLGAVPCIALMEDIDAVFNGRTNRVWPSGGLSFDCLLNAMSGVSDGNGVYIMLTTNNVDCIDSALVVSDGDGGTSRPGRIDTMLFMGAPDEAGRRMIARRILNDHPERVEDMVAAGAGETGAQFQERCCCLALALHWRTKK